nr:hypothetical protein [Tanacetum cinerariifolium]
MVAPKEVIMICLDNTKWLRQGDGRLPFQTNAFQKLYTSITEVGFLCLLEEGDKEHLEMIGKIIKSHNIALDRQQEIERREAAARSLEDAIKSENAGTPAEIYKKTRKRHELKNIARRTMFMQ